MFKELHPAANLIYFCIIIGVTIFSTDPYFVLVTLIFAWLYSFMLKGKKALRQNLMLTLPVLILMAFINTIFVHNGATILFYISDLRITLEALIFGIVGAMVLSAVIIWFSCFSEIMTSDKLIYIFGKAQPVLGLTLSMIFRFIPLLRERFLEIRLGQRAMGRKEEKGFFGKIRQFVKELSILISWSLESSIETADSMEARGYGLKGRTSFHLFRLMGRDKMMITIFIILGSVLLIGLIKGVTDIYYYPVIQMGEWGILRITVLAAYVIMLIIPVAMDLRTEKKWQLSR